MIARKLSCLVVACFIGVGLTGSATEAFSSPLSEVVVEGKRIDPELQRKISYADLNLAGKADRKTLKGRIFRTASDLCFDLNGDIGPSRCRFDGIHSTDVQFAAAVGRAQRMLAGLLVGPPVKIAMTIDAR